MGLDIGRFIGVLDTVRLDTTDVRFIFITTNTASC